MSVGGSAREPSMPCPRTERYNVSSLVSTLCLTAGDKEELLDLPTDAVATTPQGSYTRRQRLSDRIHELNKDLEEEREGGQWEVAGNYPHDTDGQVHHHRSHRIVFDEDSHRFAHLAADRAMGFRIRPPRNSVSDEEEDEYEDDDKDPGEDEDEYEDSYFDECDVDESTTLRRPATTVASASSGQVKKIVNR